MQVAINVQLVTAATDMTIKAGQQLMVHNGVVIGAAPPRLALAAPAPVHEQKTIDVAPVKEKQKRRTGAELHAERKQTSEERRQADKERKRAKRAKLRAAAAKIEAKAEAKKTAETKAEAKRHAEAATSRKLDPGAITQSLILDILSHHPMGLTTKAIGDEMMLASNDTSMRAKIGYLCRQMEKGQALEADYSLSPRCPRFSNPFKKTEPQTVQPPFEDEQPMEDMMAEAAD